MIDKLEKIMKKHNLSWSDVAKELWVTERRVQSWRYGQHPVNKHLYCLLLLKLGEIGVEDIDKVIEHV